MSALEDKFKEILGTFGDNLANDLKESLVKNDVVGGRGNASKLAGSIRFVFLTGDEMGIGITMNDYWQWVEHGRKKGKMPPIDNLIAWIKWKHRKLKPLSQKTKAASLKIKDKAERKQFKKQSYDKQIRSLAFAIGTNIKKHGTIKRDNYKGTNFVSEVLEDGRVQALSKQVAEAFGVDIKISLTEVFKDK